MVNMITALCGYFSGTFVSDTGGTFKSDTPGTFVSDIGGTFEVILSEISKITKLSWDFINVKDEFDYTSGVGLSGYKINIPTLLAGELKLVIYCPQRYYISTSDGAAYG